MRVPADFGRSAQRNPASFPPAPSLTVVVSQLTHRGIIMDVNVMAVAEFSASQFAVDHIVIRAEDIRTSQKGNHCGAVD